MCIVSRARSAAHYCLLLAALEASCSSVGNKVIVEEAGGPVTIDHCTDGVQNVDEEGVDCGGWDCGACPVPCAIVCGVGEVCDPASDACVCDADHSETGDGCQPLTVTGALDNEDPGIWSNGTLARDCSGYRFHPVRAAATVSGIYRVQPVGYAAPFEVYCDMETDGGGYMLAMVKNSADLGRVGNSPTPLHDFGASNYALDALRLDPAVSANLNLPLAGWVDLNSLDFDTLRVAAYGPGVRNYLSQPIRKRALRIAFGEDGYFLYGEEGYFWCAGDAAYTDAGIGQVNPPIGAPADCKLHGGLGSGWDFGEEDVAAVGLTMCGGETEFKFMTPTYGATAPDQGVNAVPYGQPGAAHAIFVRRDGCSNGIQDGNEAGVDCGGLCPAC